MHSLRVAGFRVVREIRLNIKTIDNAVENAVANGGTSLVSISISIERPSRPRHPVGTAFRCVCRGVLLKIHDSHCVVFITYRCARVIYGKSAMLQNK